MDCDKIDQPALLIAVFKEDHPVTLNAIYKCFFKKYYDEFKFSMIKYFDINEDEINIAFVEGLMEFNNYLVKAGFEARGATIKTFFFQFCKYKLWGIVKKLQRDNNKVVYKDPASFQEKDFSLPEIDHQSVKELEFNEQKKDEVFMKAWKQLDEKCRELVYLRKIKRKNAEQVVMKMNYPIGSVNNSVHNCTKKLKALVRKMI